MRLPSETEWSGSIVAFNIELIDQSLKLSFYRSLCSVNTCRLQLFVQIGRGDVTFSRNPLQQFQSQSNCFHARGSSCHANLPVFAMLSSIVQHDSVIKSYVRLRRIVAIVRLGRTSTTMQDTRNARKGQSQLLSHLLGINYREQCHLTPGAKRKSNRSDLSAGYSTSGRLSVVASSVAGPGLACLQCSAPRQHTKKANHPEA